MSHADRSDGPGFKRSSFCGGGDCVEVEVRAGVGVAVRHSRHPDVESIAFTTAEWRDFVKGVKAGEFDPV